MTERRTYEQLQKTFPGRIPIVITRSARERLLPDLEGGRKQFLVSSGVTVGHVMASLRKNIKLNESQALFLFVRAPDGSTVLINGSQLVAEVYDRYKAEDKFLYAEYLGEAVFGV